VRQAPPIGRPVTLRASGPIVCQRSRASSASGTLAPVPRICGREAELRVLGEALGRVVAGGAAVVLVEGEAGIGKSRLLAEVLGDARGRAYPRTSTDGSRRRLAAPACRRAELGRC